MKYPRSLPRQRIWSPTNIKVLVFDVAALHMDVVKEKKYNISNAENYIDMTNNNQEIENVLLNLTKNINKGDIDV